MEVPSSGDVCLARAWTYKLEMYYDFDIVDLFSSLLSKTPYSATSVGIWPSRDRWVRKRHATSRFTSGGIPRPSYRIGSSDELLRPPRSSVGGYCVETTIVIHVKPRGLPELDHLCRSSFRLAPLNTKLVLNIVCVSGCSVVDRLCMSGNYVHLLA
jgi:hypothetical protein